MQVLCGEIPGLDLIGFAADGATALGAIESLSPALLLLDIAMPALDGLAVARAVDGLPARPAIIFCTACEQHAIAAFDVAATDYLLKPISRERLLRGIARVRDRPARGAGGGEKGSGWMQDIWVPHRDAMIRPAVCEIDRIEAERDYMRLWRGAASYLLHETISRLDSRLDPRLFVLLRRSVIVRRTLIRSLRHDGLGNWTALLDDGTGIRVGPTFLAGVKAMLRGG